MPQPSPASAVRALSRFHPFIPVSTLSCSAPRLSRVQRFLCLPILLACRLFSAGLPTRLGSLPRSKVGADSMEKYQVTLDTLRVRRARRIDSAACLIIGDEVLGGKTVDTNSAFMAKWCFNLGITLKRIEVIADDEDEIVEAVRRMSSMYDFVVTSGGIGPTHDDITYQSLSAAFSPPYSPAHPLTLHEPAFAKIKLLSKPHPSQVNFSWDVPSAALRAKLRMVELPLCKERDDADLSSAGRGAAATTEPSEHEAVIFPCPDDLWVPVVVVAGNIHVLPGIPRLFEKLLNGLEKTLRHEGKLGFGSNSTSSQAGKQREGQEGAALHRVLIETKLAESEVAEYLGALAARVKEKGVKVGSYPRWGKSRNTVSLVGRDEQFIETLVPEVEEEVQGSRITAESENDSGKEE